MITIEIKRGIRKVKQRNYYLSSNGFEYKKTGKYTGKWILKTDNGDIKRFKHYCRRKGYEIQSWNTENNRASNCRKLYFDNYDPKLFNRYMCVYCSRLLKKNNVAVDHLISIKLVQTKKHYQHIIKWLKMENVNDPKNLVCACQKCNLKKGKNGGIWVLRGQLGKSLVYWLFIYILRVAAMSYLMYRSIPLVLPLINKFMFLEVIF